MHIGSNNKKIVAVHDLSGVGRVSLMVAIPILSTMGFQVCPLPTAILSGHTQFPTFSFLDLTDEMERIIVQWKKLGMKFDAFYTGYLGSPRQAAIVSELIADFSTEETPVIVDPVLGDNGKLYTYHRRNGRSYETTHLPCRPYHPQYDRVIFLIGKTLRRNNLRR